MRPFGLFRLLTCHTISFFPTEIFIELYQGVYVELISFIYRLNEIELQSRLKESDEVTYDLWGRGVKG